MSALALHSGTVGAMIHAPGFRGEWLESYALSVLADSIDVGVVNLAWQSAKGGQLGVVSSG